MLVQHPQQSQQRSTREQTLSSYATHLQQLSSHLDDRARVLQASETRLAASRSNISAQRHALNCLETRTRHHITHLLRHIHQRQAALVSWERTAATAKKSISSTLAAVDTVLSDAKLASINLSQTKSHNETLKAAVEQRKQQLTHIQSQLENTTASHHAVKAAIDTIAKDKQTMQRSADKLQSLEKSLRIRETHLTSKERSLAEQQLKLERLKPLETLSAHLQAFLDKAAASSLIEPISVSTDMAHAVNTAAAAINQLQQAARDLHTKGNELSTLQQHLGSREKNIRKRESELNNNQLRLDRENDALQLKRSEVSAFQAEADAAWRSIEEARKELDNREELFREKERSVQHMESRLLMRDAALAEREKALTRREKSIRRAHNAVSTRERSMEAREKALQIERTQLTDIGKSIDIRESTLETREFELSLREANRNGGPDRFVPGASNHRRPPERGPTDEFLPDPNEKQVRTEDSAVYAHDVTPVNDQANATSSLVRRQLAFDDASKDNTTEPHTKPSSRAESVAEKDDIRDDESEAAAEQLLPELVGARSYWRERVDRLDRIVQSLCTKTWATRPHVLPVLTSVAEGLLAIRRDIDDFPRPSNNTTPKNAYLQEQACQIRWRDQMKKHFDTVREIQAGLLIRLNREEGGPNSERMVDRPVEQSADSSNNAESSVDATLDVTLTGDLTRNMVRRAFRGEEDVSLSQGPSQKRVIGEAYPTSLTLNDHALYDHNEAAPALETDTSASSEDVVNHGNTTFVSSDEEHRGEVLTSDTSASVIPPGIDVAEEGAFGQNVLQELASLRDDLEQLGTIDAHRGTPNNSE